MAIRGANKEQADVIELKVKPRKCAILCLYKGLVPKETKLIRTGDETIKDMSRLEDYF